MQGLRGSRGTRGSPGQNGGPGGDGVVGAPVSLKTINWIYFNLATEYIVKGVARKGFLKLQR